MLELRPNCELCDRDLPPDSLDARICSYECTFCADCVDHRLFNVCPNCGGGFTNRPIRPSTAWRSGVSVHLQPATASRTNNTSDRDDIDDFTRKIRDIPPRDR